MTKTITRRAALTGSLAAAIAAPANAAPIAITAKGKAVADKLADLQAAMESCERA